jgi:hypothetical protein
MEPKCKFFLTQANVRFCGCEVRYVKRGTGKNKWTVYFAWHGNKRNKFGNSIYTEPMWVQAREFVFLGAGSLGTTEILLRSSERGLTMSPLLGKNMSGNGDILAFGHNTDRIVNAVGKQDSNHVVGPCITGIIDMRDEQVSPNILDGYVIEEGAFPEAMANVFKTLFDALNLFRAPKGVPFIHYFLNFVTTIASTFTSVYKKGGSLNRTMVYLVMSHDNNQGSLILDDDKPHLQFRDTANDCRIEGLCKVLAKATELIGGRFVINPLSSIFGSKQFTVHPLGGANMSSDGTGRNGVTNHLGQVFTGQDNSVYEGLVVVDGSVIPTSLGVNPFATITAFAEWSVAGVARQHDIRIDYEKKNGISLTFF